MTGVIKQAQPAAAWEHPAASSSGTAQFVYVLGDIHGCIKELRTLEAKIFKHAAQHNASAFIVSVGDMIDRGPGSIEVVEHFYQGVNNGTHAVLAGNHEQNYVHALLAELPDEYVKRELPFPVYAQRSLNPYVSSALIDSDLAVQRRQAWYTHGGDTTVAELGAGAQPDSQWFMSDHLMQFLCRLPLCWFNARVLVTHALIDNVYAKMLINKTADIPGCLSAEQYKQLLRLALWSRELPGQAPDSARIHVSGHTPMHSVQRVPDLNILRIDTSCVYGYSLTAWSAETDELLCVPSSMPCID